VPDIAKANPYHEPAGTPEGGQFASAPGGSDVPEFHFPTDAEKWIEHQTGVRPGQIDLRPPFGLPDPSVLRESAVALASLASKFPETFARMSVACDQDGSLLPGFLRGGIMCTNADSLQITLSPFLMTAPDTRNRLFERSEQSGWFPSGCASWGACLDHEFGHVLAVSDPDAARMSETLWGGGAAKRDGRATGYGAVSEQEYWACMVASAMNTPSAQMSDDAREVKAYLDQRSALERDPAAYAKEQAIREQAAAIASGKKMVKSAPKPAPKKPVVGGPAFLALSKKIIEEGYNDAYAIGWADAMALSEDSDNPFEDISETVDPPANWTDAQLASYAEGVEAFQESEDFGGGDDANEDSGSSAADQSHYLAGVAALLAAGALTVGQFAARMSAYAASLYGLYEHGFGDGAGAHGEVTTVTWQTAGDGTVCELCAMRDGKVWNVDGDYPYPGEGLFGDQCEGGPFCRCELIYDIVPTSDAGALDGGDAGQADDGSAVSEIPDDGGAAPEPSDDEFEEGDQMDDEGKSEHLRPGGLDLSTFTVVELLKLRQIAAKYGSDALKFNPYHEPGGTSEGGRFASADSAGDGGASDREARLSAILAMSVSDRKAAFRALPTEQRNALADPTHSIGSAIRQNLEGVGPRPTGMTPEEGVAARVAQYGAAGIVVEDGRLRIEEMAKGIVTSAQALGVPGNLAMKMGLDAADTLAAQEVETYGRVLGDHGMRHIEGDASMALDTLAAVPHDASPSERLEVLLAATYHDTGYLTPTGRAFLDSDHAAWGMQYYDATTKADVAQAIGQDAADRISTMIDTHQSADLDWKGDPEGSAFRLADNLALFEEQKMPAVLEYVPGNTDVLVRMATGAISTDEAQSEMLANITRADLSPAVADQFRDATAEVSPTLPRFTLGMVGGKISDIGWSDDHVDVTVERTSANVALSKILDMGRSQFEKFASTYNVDPADFLKTDHFTFSKDGKTLLEVKVVGHSLMKALLDLMALEKFNPYHDEVGRFTSVGGVGEAVDRSAQALVDRARAVEPRLTAALQRVAAKTGGNLDATIHQWPHGDPVLDKNGDPKHTLTYSVKSVGRTADKISGDMQTKFSDPPANEHPLTVGRSAAQIFDCNRYTLVYPSQSYAPDSVQAIEAMKDEGLEPVRSKDFWEVPNGYAAINSVWRDTTSGALIEMQYHTQDTLDFKETVSHPLFEQARDLPDDDPRKAALMDDIDRGWTQIRSNTPYLDSIQAYLKTVFPEAT
jgi:hypothetical protein